MVGHTGSIPAVVRAVETADRCLGRVVASVTEAGGACLITADHGNAEQMLEPDGVSPHTAHTTNPVPLIVTAPGATVRPGGELADLAPTVLQLLGIEPPSAMTGQGLVNRT
jgi:2,3-bisphosphoglycerate-independent phosphoglycerate mutase